MKQFCFLLMLMINYVFGIAQVSKSDADDNVSHFKITGSYLSNSIYNGRKDSLVTPYFTPSVGYFKKNGLYITGALSYLKTASISRVDLYSFDIGYDFDLSDKLSGGVYFEKYFYTDSSTAIKSDIKGSLGGNLSYDLAIFQLNLGADILLAQKTDIAINMGIAHAFSFGEPSNEFSITPAFTANMGTLHFYEGFTNRKAGKKANSIIPNLLSIASTTTVNNNKFTLLDFELSIPFAYDARNFGLFISPTFTFPKNPIYTTTSNLIKLRNGTQYTQVQDSTPMEEKKLSNSFFIDAGIYIKF